MIFFIEEIVILSPILNYKLIDLKIADINFELMKSDSIQSVIGTPKWEPRPKLHRYPTKRWGHTGAISKNKLFIYGGKTGRSKEPLYEIDCESF